MSAATTKARSGSRRRTPASRGQVLKRRLLVLLAAVAGALAATIALSPWADKAVQELSLPLRHEDVIRQQAEDKQLDPALIAGVIYAESRFRDATSPAGAKGLMQLMPETAQYIADKSGGTRFVQGDLADPQVNISYGAWYLRYLLDHYHGNEVLALAAYNAGEGAVDAWWREAAGGEEEFRADDHIPYAETREYVSRVLEARRSYRREYRAELGL